MKHSTNGIHILFRFFILFIFIGVIKTEKEASPKTRERRTGRQKRQRRQKRRYICDVQQDKDNISPGPEQGCVSIRISPLYDDKYEINALTSAMPRALIV